MVCIALRSGSSARPTLPEGDEYEHSQNSACRSMMPPCHNRGPAKYERKLFGYARVSVGSDADANNLENQRRVLADCEQGFKDVGRCNRRSLFEKIPLLQVGLRSGLNPPLC